MKKALSILLTLCLLASAASLLVASAADIEFEISQESTGYTYAGGVLTVKPNGNITVSTNGETNHKIEVTGNATITLAGVTCTPGTDAPAIDIQNSAHLTLILAPGSINTLTGTSDTATANPYRGNPGIHVPATASLTIQGNTGTLEATGAASSGHVGSGAGIGSKGGAMDQPGDTSGSITIEGGVITATGGGNNASGSSGGTGAGIGSGGGGSGVGGSGGVVTKIEISGGELTANGGESTSGGGGTGAGIGSGGGGFAGSAGSGSSGGVVTKIEISGGELTANGGNASGDGGTGAGIGSGGGGFSSSNGNSGGNGGGVTKIEISDGELTANGGNASGSGGTGAGIGSGGGGGSSNGVGGSGGVTKIEISDGELTANGGESTSGDAGAGIGSGGGADGSSGNGSLGTVESLSITGGVPTNTTFSSKDAIITGQIITYKDRTGSAANVELLYVDFSSGTSKAPTATLPTAERLRYYSTDFPEVSQHGWADADDNLKGKPGEPLTLSPADPLTLYNVLRTQYSVTIDPNLQNGEITANPTQAMELGEIRLTVTPNDGYRLKEGSLYYIAEGSTQRVEIEDNAFPMPGANVTVYAAFELIQEPPEPPEPGPQYEIATGKNIQNGTASANKTKARADELITVTLRPDREFEYDEGTLYYIEEETGHKTFIDDYDESTGKYTFPMPADNITIYAEFIPVLYEITIDENIQLGAVDTDVFEAAKGQTVTVSVFPDDTYQLIEGSLTYQIGDRKPVKIEGDQFEMPSGDVEITAEFELKEIFIVGDYLYDREGNQLFDQEYIDENGNSYYFDADGKMLRDTFRTITNSPDVYYYNSDGKMLKNGWLDTEGGSYYFGPEGKMLRSSWLQEDENHYYFGEDGILYRDVFIKIGEYWYYFDENGVMVKDREVHFPGS